MPVEATRADRDQCGAAPIPQRADARRNHARLLDAAQAVLAESPHASLRSIAQQAGVGQGTLYRHFPDRDALLVQAYRAELELLADELGRLASSQPPLTALRLWFRRLPSSAGTSEAVAAALRAGLTLNSLGPQHNPLARAAATVLDAAVTTGALRPDPAVQQLMDLLGRLWQATRSRQLVDLIIDALEARDTGAQS